MLQYFQDSFGGGLNTLKCEAALADDEYVIGINTRARTTSLESIKKPLLVHSPKGKKQGIYGFGSILVLFVDGRAYYRLITATQWTKIINLQLSKTVDTIYALAVPQSSQNYLRKLSTTNDINGSVVLTSKVNAPTPITLICQDGINQPWLIFEDGTARVANNYDDWTLDNREYVPIGKQMLYYNGKAFIVSPDGHSIYPSVSGRPLDFVINIDINGDKGGDATTTSYAVDHNIITCICALNTNYFIVATAYNVYAVSFNTSKTVFAEPTYDNIPLFVAGVVNQFSFIEGLSDFYFMDFEGIKSFNAVLQLKFEGNNDIISKNVVSLFKDIKQNPNFCCGVTFDNYILFSVLTTYSHGVLVYDTILQKYVSLDITVAAPIKQFATIYNESIQVLYAITDKEVYHIYGSSSYETSILLTRAFTTDKARILETGYSESRKAEQKSTLIKINFEEGVEDGAVYATELVDNRVSDDVKLKDIIYNHLGISNPIMAGPFIQRKSPEVMMFNFPSGLTGTRLNYLIKWSGGSSIDCIEIRSTINTQDVPVTQQAKKYG